MLKKLLRNVDYSLVIATVGLCVFGLVMIYSSSYWIAFHYDLEADYFFKRQLIFILAGLLVFFFALIFPYKAYIKLTKPLILVTISLLVLVFLLGKVVNNAQSWISLGGFNLQPAEVAKLAIIIYLSSILAKKQSYISDFNRAVAPPLVVVALISFLILMQPDFGSMLILVSIAASILICAKLRFRHLMFLSLSSILLMTVFFMFVASDEQISRFKGAYAPFEYQKEGYQLINSYVAISAGGMNGVGLGNGITKYGYLPEGQTDFIIANVSEEFGFAGVLAALIGLFYIVIRGFIIGLRSKDTFGRLLAFGISSMIGVQSFINLGAATGLLPVTGVPLPFLSYGGSSLLVLMFSMGVLANVSAFVNMKRKATDEQPVPAAKPANYPSASTVVSFQKKKPAH
ncbi:cell division protein FtsW [Fictibacillus solisalsi]|uniref:Probable peptidoglycan glycosyltransferase FtsW n=1 Tax=Fictibacillus solisalsi TaxID=459525 RepID=A0A1G9Y3E9_9BACL|nr:FtsW/RodA/SpoVE family cell cycle protein [Fictibacillus solisalsi]SDN03588.1 cell division protein FtsW [Fictibacillus solisalsi]